MKRMIKVFLAIAAIAFGIVFGANWGINRYCFGDDVFSLLGIPPWSGGTTGTHYPAIIGSIFIIAGICVINSALNKKARFRVWSIVIVLLVALNFAVTYM